MHRSRRRRMMHPYGSVTCKTRGLSAQGAHASVDVAFWLFVSASHCITHTLIIFASGLQQHDSCSNFLLQLSG